MEATCRVCSSCHLETDCPEKVRKCKNCSGEHTADSKLCPSFIAYKKRKIKTVGRNRFAALETKENMNSDKVDELQKDGTPFPYGYPMKQTRKKLKKIHMPKNNYSDVLKANKQRKFSEEDHEQAKERLEESKNKDSKFEKMIELIVEQNKNVMNVLTMMMTTLTTLVNNLNQKNAGNNNPMPSSF
ncbi:hypothetical protein MHBO_004363 [Bonamia ostreae]|uniref:Uncharacterized protein n=1 Tax=Bonamia ostreae TaxID=126728 RepID=A0ABV2AT33_9EUKA